MNFDLKSCLAFLKETNVSSPTMLPKCSENITQKEDNIDSPNADNLRQLRQCNCDRCSKVRCDKINPTRNDVIVEESSTLKDHDLQSENIKVSASSSALSALHAHQPISFSTVQDTKRSCPDVCQSARGDSPPKGGYPAGMIQKAEKVAGNVLKQNPDLIKTKPLSTITSYCPQRYLQPFQSLRICVMDIETTGLDPDCFRVVAVGFRINGRVTIIMDPDERSLLKKAMTFLENTPMDVLVGHNIFDFDLPFLTKRMAHYRMKRLFIEVPLKEPRKVNRNRSRPVLMKSEYRFQNVSIVDTLHLSAKYDDVVNVLSNYKLKSVVLELGLRTKPRLDVQTGISELFTRGDHQTIRGYLEFDLEDTLLLCAKLLPPYYYIQEIVPELAVIYGKICHPDLQQIVYWSGAKILEALLETHYKCLPKADTKQKYPGGYCLCHPGLYKSAAKIDVSSMYPSIMLSYRIHSRKDPEGFALSVLNYLTEQRLKWKKLAKSGNAEANYRQESLKLLINSFYGFYGCEHFAYNDMEAAKRVTALGRELAGKMEVQVKMSGCPVIEIDTDGIMFQSRIPGIVMQQVQDSLPEGFKVDLEFRDVTIYVPKAKNYLIFSGDGTVCKKGLFRKRNAAPFEAEFHIEYVRLLQKSAMAAQQYYRSEVQRLEDGTMDTERLTIRKRVAKNERQFLHLGIKPGDQIAYYQGYDEKNNPAPVTQGPYHKEYYLRKLRDFRSEIEKIVTMTNSFPDEPSPQETGSEFNDSDGSSPIKIANDDHSVSS